MTTAPPVQRRTGFGHEPPLTSNIRLLISSLTAIIKHDQRNQAAPSEYMMISTRFTEHFGIKHPIVCAPMALVTAGELAAAVCRAGGLGDRYGGGYAGTLGAEPNLETELCRAESGEFGVDFITWALARAPEMLTKALQTFAVMRVAFIRRPSTVAAAEIHDAGAALICQVQFLSQIDAALEAGAAAIDRTGHQGQGGTEETVQRFRLCRKLPTTGNTLAQNLAGCRRRHRGRERIGSSLDARC